MAKAWARRCPQATRAIHDHSCQRLPTASHEPRPARQVHRAIENACVGVSRCALEICAIVSWRHCMATNRELTRVQVLRARTTILRFGEAVATNLWLTYYLYYRT